MASGPYDGADTRQVATARSFGFEWSRFPETRDEWERNFLEYVAPHGPDFFHGKRVLDAGGWPAPTAKFSTSCADNNYSINELTQEVAHAMGRPGHPVIHLPPRDEVTYAYSDHSKAARVFGVQPLTPLREGLKKMASWALRAGIHRAKPFEELEVSRNLPPSWRGVATAKGDDDHATRPRGRPSAGRIHNR